MEISVGNFPTSPDPVHGTTALGEAFKCGDPLYIGNIAIGISQQSAGVIVPGLDEIVRGLDEVLVVSIVEQVTSSHCPHVFEQRVCGMHPPYEICLQPNGTNKCNIVGKELKIFSRA